jgi:hypothetical protein
MSICRNQLEFLDGWALRLLKAKAPTPITPAAINT